MGGLKISSGWSLGNENNKHHHHHHHHPDEDVDEREWSKCGQTGRTDALLSVSSPWTTPDYLTNKTIIIIVVVIIIMIWIWTAKEHQWIASLALKKTTLDETSIYLKHFFSTFTPGHTYWIRLSLRKVTHYHSSHRRRRRRRDYHLYSESTVV